MQKKALTIPQACERLGVKTTTIYKLFKSGDLAQRKIGGRTVILESDVDAYLDALPVVNAA